MAGSLGGAVVLDGLTTRRWGRTQLRWSTHYARGTPATACGQGGRQNPDAVVLARGQCCGRQLHPLPVRGEDEPP
ncbi:MAG: hypothetical protein ACRDSH_08895, partial [Pseudonocardiaceae bacterium]